MVTAPSLEGPPFDIDVDETTGVVRTVLRGFWTLGDLAEFGQGMFQAVTQIARRHAVFGLLGDATLFKIQSTEVSEGFAKMMDSGNRAHTGPTAIVVGSTLNKLQAERLFTDPQVRIFTDLAQAARWVDAELAEARR